MACPSQAAGNRTATQLSCSSPAPISSLFNLSQGDLTFSLKSSHNLSERQALIPVEHVFQADDGTRTLFGCTVYASNSRLVFAFATGGAAGYYYLPPGQADQLFGKGIVAKFRMTWDGSRQTLYINDVSVASLAYTPYPAAWSSTASFTIGASSMAPYGGYYAADDSIADFTIK